jgi:aminoglycoside 6'-N-acetyltransferase I
LTGGVRVDRLTPDSPLARWAAAIEAAEWDEDNAIDAPYSAASLAAYVASPDNVFVLAHDGATVLGMASGTLLRKPYGDERWCYVDEVDVAVPHRRRGVGRALMERFLRLARQEGCGELWLGTERDNGPALALYRGLGGDEDDFVGFNFEQ